MNRTVAPMAEKAIFDTCILINLLDKKIDPPVFFGRLKG
jgi:hypothetical protein